MIRYTDHTTGHTRTQKTVFEWGNGRKEIHLLVSADRSGKHGTREAVGSLVEACRKEAEEENAAVIFQRFFSGDAPACAGAVGAAMKDRPPRAVSVVGQAPVRCAAAVWAYMATDTEVSAAEGGLVKARSAGISEIWAANVTAPGAREREQTENIFAGYASGLARLGMSLAGNCQRTWLFVSDIDSRYAGMVEGRNNAFDKQGLTREAHFIASTGIAGESPEKESLVMMDAVAYENLPEGSIHYLYAPERMNRTSKYGVRFERGTAVDLPGARKVFVSGTASIDNRGEIVHRGDVLLQTERMMGNVEALLSEAGCGTEDVQQALVYLRNEEDYDRVEGWFKDHCPSMPRLILHAPVCRPDWLVELECMAVKRVLPHF